MPSLLQIIVHTPLWVWPLLVLVVGLGIVGLRPRVLSPWRLAILPLVGLGMTLAGIMQSARPVTAAVGWALALLAAVPLGRALGRRQTAHWLPDGRLQVSGGWFMLSFGLAIFAVRYALGVLFGVLPALKVEPLWVVVSSGIGGAVAGVGLGWLAGVLWRARRAPLPAG